MSANKLTPKKLVDGFGQRFQDLQDMRQAQCLYFRPCTRAEKLRGHIFDPPIMYGRDIELPNFAQARLGDSWLERVHRPLHEATHKQTGSPGCLWVGCVVVVEDRRSTLESCMGMGIAGKPREHRGNGDKTGGNTAGMGTVNVTNVTTAFVQ